MKVKLLIFDQEVIPVNIKLKWPMEPALISGFCSVKRMRVLDSPG